MLKHRVLITSVSGSFGPKNIEFMKNAYKGNVWVLGVDVQHDYVAEKVADMFLKVPPGDSDEYIEAIMRLIDLYKITIILPCSDEEAINLSNNRIKIESKNVLLATAEASAIKVMSNKILTYKMFQKAGIIVPNFKIADNLNEAKNNIELFYKNSKSFVLKEPIARGNRGTLLIDENIKGVQDYMGSRELHMGWDYFNENFLSESVLNFPLLITERLYKPAYDVDILAKNGKVIHAIPRERINPAGVPYKGNIIRNNSKLIELAEKVSHTLNISWLYDLDVMTKYNGEPAVLEINPRPSGSSVASMELGVPLYKNLLSLYRTDSFETFDDLKDGTIISPSLVCNII